MVIIRFIHKKGLCIQQSFSFWLNLISIHLCELSIFPLCCVFFSHKLSIFVLWVYFQTAVAIVFFFLLPVLLKQTLLFSFLTNSFTFLNFCLIFKCLIYFEQGLQLPGSICLLVILFIVLYPLIFLLQIEEHPSVFAVIQILLWGIPSASVCPKLSLFFLHT